MSHTTVKEKAKKAFDHLKKDFKYTNKLQAPRIEKVIVSTTIGSIKDAKKKELMLDRVTKITGQKPVTTTAKQSIATFKLRAGDPSGYKVTLRGEKMWSFLEKVVNIGLPRTKDFRGIAATGVDPMGNFSFGIKEHTVFPETSDENIADVFSLGVTVVTTSKAAPETKAFLDTLGFLFKKADEKKK
ncbi:MAG: 50S ribosomal protein L5 [Patescibacteria group bacterium]